MSPVRPPLNVMVGWRMAGLGARNVVAGGPSRLYSWKPNRRMPSPAPPAVQYTNTMLTPQQTWASIAAHVRLLPASARPLHEALGHVLAQDVSADRDFPPADRSAMDGFAVRAADVAH